RVRPRARGLRAHGGRRHRRRDRSRYRRPGEGAWVRPLRASHPYADSVTSVAEASAFNAAAAEAGAVDVHAGLCLMAGVPVRGVCLVDRAGRADDGLAALPALLGVRAAGPKAVVVGLDIRLRDQVDVRRGAADLLRAAEFRTLL